MHLGETQTPGPTGIFTNADPILTTSGVPCASPAMQGPLLPGQVYCSTGNLVPCLNGTGPLAPGQAYCAGAGQVFDDAGNPTTNTIECAGEGLVWDPTLQACVDPNTGIPVATSSWFSGISNNTVLLAGGALAVLFLMERRK
jgi:hypothetical protein